MNGKQLIRRLAILNENIASEAALQPSLFVDAARYRVAKMRKRAQIGAKLQYEQARIAMLIRNRKNERGEKMTEGALKERVETKLIIKRLRAASDRAYEEEEMSKSIQEAFRQRNSAIKIIAELQIAEGNRESAQIEKDEQHKKLVARARSVIGRRKPNQGVYPIED